MIITLSEVNVCVKVFKLRHPHVKKLFPKKDILEGMLIEREHINNPLTNIGGDIYTIFLITLAHLFENKHYYKLLKKLNL